MVFQEAFVVLCVVCVIYIRADYDEGRLKSHLLDNYSRITDRGARPVKNPSDALEVDFGLSLQQILDLDKEKGVLTTLIWLNYMWKDTLLAWNSTAYAGVKSLRFAPYEIYVPDIVAYNVVHMEYSFGRPTDIVVYNDGTCSWVPPMTLKTSCAADPDSIEQRCTLKFGSWTYDGTKLNLTSRANEIDYSTYQTSLKYDLLSVPAERHVERYECCPEPYIDITFTLNLKERKAKRQ